MSLLTLNSLVLLIILGIIISYYDVRYRRIPNVYVLAGCVSGLFLNSWYLGWHGVQESLTGCVLAFGLMFLVRLYSRATGAGDIKLFAAIGAIIGWSAVLPTFLIVLITGAVLAFLNSLRQGTLRVTLERVALILYGFLPGQQVPRFPIPADQKKALPYGVAICLGSLIALMRELPQFG
jgi:prepilin peptidase CpaA